MEGHTWAALEKLSSHETFQQGVDEMTQIFASEPSGGGEGVVATLAAAVTQWGHRSVQCRAELLQLLQLAIQLDPSSSPPPPLASRLATALLTRARLESDARVLSVLSEAIGALVALLDGSSVLSLFVVPVFRMLREPDPAAQRGGALALRATLSAFPDVDLLHSNLVKIATPLLKLFAQREFAGRLECVECVELLAARVGGGLADPNVREGAADMALRAMAAVGSEHDWPMRRQGIRLARRLLAGPREMQPAAASALGKAVVSLRFDKIDLVRQEALGAMEALGLQEPPEDRRQRDPNGTLSSRTPLRARPVNPRFDRSQEDFSSEHSDMVLVGPGVSDRPLPRPASEDSLILSEIRTLKKQQEELLQVITGLSKAVESGMRTLNSRVRSLEEQMHDLTDAVDEYRDALAPRKKT